MQTAILRWGNSQGIRLPKYLLESVSMTNSDKVEVIAENDRLIIKKLSQIAHKTTKERLDGFNEDYIFEEWQTGEDTGCEVINDEYV